MKGKLIFILVLFMCIGAVLGIFCYNTLNKTEYTLNLPKEAENYLSITLEYNNDERTIETSENIQNVLNILVSTERITTEESIQDSPTDVEEELEIDIAFDKGATSTIFAYKKADKYYIEQPYNGVYEITQEEYNDINKFYQDLKVETTKMETDSLTKRVDNLAPVDQLGKSFKTSELTNDELLRLGYSIFGPVKNFGFLDITFENLNRTYIKGFFGREDATAKDILCSCGETIATYNSSNDTYTWDQEFHYLNHKSDTFNEIKDMYKIEDKYIVEVYKIFPDLLMNSSTTQYNFYATYNDAANQENALFTVTNEDEFTNALENLDDSQKVLYTLTFKRDGTFKLVNYEINK